MSLYDDIDTDKKSESLSGWASGIKFLQSHMKLKKATMTQVSGILNFCNLSKMIEYENENYISIINFSPRETFRENSPLVRECPQLLTSKLKLQVIMTVTIL